VRREKKFYYVIVDAGAGIGACELDCNSSMKEILVCIVNEWIIDRIQQRNMRNKIQIRLKCFTSNTLPFLNIALHISINKSVLPATVYIASHILNL
jgi:hypothetical protein